MNVRIFRKYLRHSVQSIGDDGEPIGKEELVELRFELAVPTSEFMWWNDAVEDITKRDSDVKYVDRAEKDSVSKIRLSLQASAMWAKDAIQLIVHRKNDDDGSGAQLVRYYETSDGNQIQYICCQNCLDDAANILKRELLKWDEIFPSKPDQLATCHICNRTYLEK